MPPSPRLNARQAKHLEFQAAPVPKFLQAFKEKVQPAPRRSEWDDALGVGSSREAPGARDDGLLPDSEDEDEWEGAHVVVLDEKKNLTLEEARNASQAQSSAQGMHSPPWSHLVHGLTLTGPASVSGVKEDEAPSPAPLAQAGQPGAPLRPKRRAAPVGQAEEESRKVPRVEASSKKDKMDDVRALIAERKAAPPRPQDEKLSGRVLIEQDDPRDRAKAREHLVNEVGTKDEATSKASTKEAKRKKKNEAARKEIKKRGKGLSFDMED